MEDKDLLSLFFNEGNKHYAFNLIVRKHSQKLYWVIRRIVLLHEDADDVLQNTFIKVWRALPSFNKNSTLYTWMYRIAVNEALSFIKKNKKRKNSTGLNALKQLESDPDFNGDKAYLEFLKAIDTLPQKQQVVFKLKYFEELKYSEIAEILGGTEGSLKASYFHAVKKIEKLITSV